MTAKRIIAVALAAVAATTPLACTQIDRAVKGVESGPGGWQRLGQSRAEMTSDVQYIGASADGAIIVRMPDGAIQMWKR